MRLEDNDLLKHVPLEKPSRPSSCTTKNLDEVDQDFELFFFSIKKWVRWESNQNPCVFLEYGIALIGFNQVSKMHYECIYFSEATKLDLAGHFE